LEEMNSDSASSSALPLRTVRTHDNITATDHARQHFGDSHNTHTNHINISTTPIRARLSSSSNAVAQIFKAPSTSSPATTAALRSDQSKALYQG
jgi:hypothetical protein